MPAGFFRPCCWPVQRRRWSQSASPLPPADTLTMLSERTAPCWPGETASTARWAPRTRTRCPGRRPMSCWRMPGMWTRGLSRPPPLTRMGPSGAGAATRAGPSARRSRTGCWRTWCPYQSGRRNVLPCALTGRCGPGAPGPECPWRNIRMIPTIRLPRYWTRWFSCLGIWR